MAVTKYPQASVWAHFKTDTRPSAVTADTLQLSPTADTRHQSSRMMLVGPGKDMPLASTSQTSLEASQLQAFLTWLKQMFVDKPRPPRHLTFGQTYHQHLLWSTNVSGCQSRTSPVAIPLSTSAATAAGTATAAATTAAATATATVAVTYAANCSATMSPTIEDLYFQINADPSDE